MIRTLKAEDSASGDQFVREGAWTVDLGLTGKVALVTGASRGIGAAIAAGLAAEGCRVAVVARGKQGLADLVDRLREAGAEALLLVADLTEPAAAAEVVRQVEETFGRLDILVNNLGGGTEGDTDEAWLATRAWARRLERQALTSGTWAADLAAAVSAPPPTALGEQAVRAASAAIDEILS